MDEKKIDVTEESRKSWAAPKVTCLSESHTLGGTTFKTVSEGVVYYS